MLSKYQTFSILPTLLYLMGFSPLGHLMNEGSHWLGVSYCVYCGASTAAELGDRLDHSLILVSLLWKFHQVSVCHPEILLSPHP